MELEEKKNFKALTALVDDFQKEGDTIFAIFGIGDECGIYLTGEAPVIGSGFLHALMKGLGDSSDGDAFKIVTSLLFAIKKILSEESEESQRLAALIQFSIDCAEQEKLGNFNADDLRQLFKYLKESQLSMRCNNKKTYDESAN